MPSGHSSGAVTPSVVGLDRPESVDNSVVENESVVDSVLSPRVQPPGAMGTQVCKESFNFNML